MPIILHRSHRLEWLAEALAHQLQSNPKPPLERERIVVSSLGMRRWLSYELAQKLGVAANFEFPFPAQFFEEALKELAETAPDPIFRREILHWKIHFLLPGLLTEPEFSSLQRYVGDDALKLWQLSAQLAGVFDRYLAYRPDLLLQWSAGELKQGEAWQARLWREVAGNLPFAARILAERPEPGGRKKKRGSSPDQPELPFLDPQPSRFSPAPIATPSASMALFGLTTLSPFYVQMLGVLAQRAVVHLYVLTPTREYWGDIRSAREQARLQRWRSKRGLSSEATVVHDPHPLLASLGRIGREFHEALLDLLPTSEPEYFDHPPSLDSHEAGESISSGESPSLLARVQASLVNLELPAAPPAFAEADYSIRFHSCHSPLRELEVLHDQLLQLFQSDPSLEPRDVLVSVPDMDTYAPCIEAIFGAPENDAVRFPFSIADRAARVENPVAASLLSILHLLDSRMAASAVMSLLDQEPIRLRFDLTETDLPLLREWVAASGIRWGIDAEHRAGLSLPASHEHTWRFGLDRLILGFALPPDGEHLCAGILPEADVEGQLAEILGKFAAFTQTLFGAARRVVPLQLSAQQWSETLRGLLAESCSADDTLAAHYWKVSEVLEALATQAHEAGHTTELPFTVIRSHLQVAFADDDSGSGFLRGGITFCSMKPMRAIPHRVVALLGMNYDAFPRAGKSLAFDLTASHPLPGDRTLRDDDRYLFLEMLMSARDALLISYVGQSIMDNSVRPPSVLVAELMDHLDRYYGDEKASQKLSTRLTTPHRLQAFSPRYFSGQREWFTFSEENARAAQAARQIRQSRSIFAQRLNPSPVHRTVAFTTLVEALEHPTRYFVRMRLGLSLPSEETSVEDSEPMSIDPLERYRLGAGLVEQRLHRAAETSLLPVTRAGAILPHGYAGDSAFAAVDLRAQQLMEAIAEHAPGGPLPPWTFHLPVADWTIYGSLSPWTESAFLRYRPGRLRARDRLAAWLSHLVICLAAPSDRPRSTVALGIEDECSFPAVSAAEAQRELLNLLALFERAHQEALPFFPESSLVFADYRLNLTGKKKSPPLAEATKKWAGGPYQQVPPESADNWYALVWADHPSPLDETFEQLALAVYAPMLTLLHRGQMSTGGAR